MPIPRYDPSAVELRTVVARFGIFVPPMLLLLGGAVVLAHSRQDQAMQLELLVDERRHADAATRSIETMFLAISEELLRSIESSDIPSSLETAKPLWDALVDPDRRGIAWSLRIEDSQGEALSTVASDSLPTDSDSSWITLRRTNARAELETKPNRNHVEFSFELAPWLASVEARHAFFGRLKPVDARPIGGSTTGAPSEALPSNGWLVDATMMLPPPLSGRITHSGDSPRRVDFAQLRLQSVIPTGIVMERCSALHRGFAGLFIALGSGIVIAAWIVARYAAQRDASSLRAFQADRLAAIGEAMTALAHESRNAIQRGQASIEMLAKRVRDIPQAEKLLAQVQGAQEDLHQLYERVRSYAAPVPLNLKRVDIGEIVDEAWQNVLPTLKGRAAHYTTRVRIDDRVALVDPFAIRQAIQNILENAVSADLDEEHPRDEVQIDVNIGEARLSGRAAIFISIRDNGPGIDAERARQIFEPFFTTRSRGTGLGMAISRRLVEMHGGRIEIADTALPGATFIVTLPKEAL